MKTEGKTASELISISVQAREIVAQEFSESVARDLMAEAAEGEVAEFPDAPGYAKYVGKRSGVVWQVVLLGGPSET